MSGHWRHAGVLVEVGAGVVTAALAVAACSENGAPRAIDCRDGSVCGGGGASAPTAGAGGAAGSASGGVAGRNEPVLVLPEAGGDGGGDPTVCADVELMLGRTIPTVVLLIDQSDSMDLPLEESSSLTRWEALKGVLLAPDTGIIPALESEIRFGVVLYGNAMPYFPECPDLVEVMPPVLQNYARIQEVYGAAGTIPNTPTAESMRAVIAGLEAVREPGPEYVLLATDGDPDRCDVNGGQIRHDDESKALAVSAVEDAYAQGIGTFVVGVGRGTVTRSHLQALANAGAGLPSSASPGAEYYEVDTQEGLRRTLSSLVGSVRTCEFDLRGEVDPAYADRGTVTLDASILPMSDEDGWRLVSPTRIELTGTACEALKVGDHELHAVFPCEAIVVR